MINYDDRFSDYDGKIIMPCPPFGDGIIRYHKDKNWLRFFNKTHMRIMKNWNSYWDKIYKATCEQMAFYEQPNNFGIYPFEIHINKSGGWIKDDVMFELIFTSGCDEDNNGPFWVVAFKGIKVIHAQASF